MIRLLLQISHRPFASSKSGTGKISSWNVQADNRCVKMISFWLCLIDVANKTTNLLNLNIPQSGVHIMPFRLGSYFAVTASIDLGSVGDYISAYCIIFAL